jgi:hypothetical protein
MVCVPGGNATIKECNRPRNDAMVPGAVDQEHVACRTKPHGALPRKRRLSIFALINDRIRGPLFQVASV